MVDATFIHVPSSIKNREQARDPEMRQIRSSNPYYFGMKVHVGANMDSGTVHTAEVTAANEAVINVLLSCCGHKTKLSWAMRLSQ